MKKLILSAFGFMLLSVAAVQANPVLKASTITQVQQDQNKAEVKPDSLPEPVKTTLQGEAFVGWEIDKAYLVTKADDTQYFEINLKKGEETASVNLDKEGKKVD
jgi:hypothetical protein